MSECFHILTVVAQYLKWSGWPLDGLNLSSHKIRESSFLAFCMNGLERHFVIYI